MALETKKNKFTGSDIEVSLTEIEKKGNQSPSSAAEGPAKFEQREK